MKRRISLAVLAALLLAMPGSVAAQAEHHRATHLGNPATRFAPTMYAPEDLRARFRDPKLQGDFIEVLQQWGWTGNYDDFFAAGLTNEISEWEIPVGDTMPFMSTRKDGQPICLRNVTWAGPEPIHAYAFLFHSNGRLYRCITPKPCSNFFVVDLGPEPKAGLAIDCDVPEKVIVGRPARICLTLHNTGNLTEPQATVTLPIPDGAVATATTDGGTIVNNSVTWKISDVPANTAKQFCAVFKTLKPATLLFAATASSAAAAPVTSAGETAVVGIPAILLEKSDDPDPLAVGEATTYTVRVTNQGTGDDSNVQIMVVIAPELTPVSSTEGTIDGQIVRFPTVPKLAAKEAVTYKIVAKGVSVGDGHTKFILLSDMLKSSISAEESTTVY